MVVPVPVKKAALPEWERLINACLEQQDIEGVGHALRLMALDKPREAADMLGFLRTAVRAAEREASS